MKSTRFLCAASAFGLALAISQPASAQEAGANNPEDCEVFTTDDDRAACIARRDDVQSDVSTPAASDDGGAIVITGSRIRRSEFNSSDPITIIDPALAAKQGQNELAEIIQSSPIAAGSTQIISSISTNFVTNGGADAQTVSLRGLGAERTLVLLNGRRAGPAGVRGAVTSFDFNVLPSSIVRSVEILKTGASSIYGSDAIAGVVNIITKTNTDGVEFNGFASVPTEGAREIYNVNATYGKTFDRGHILATVDYFKANSLKRNDRDFLFCEEEFLTRIDGTTRADIVDFRTGQPACGGTIGNLVLTNNDFTGPGFSNGLLGPNGRQLFIGQYSEPGADLSQVGVAINGFPGVTAPANFFGLNFDGPSTGALNQFEPLEQTSDVFSEVERYSAYVDAAFNITDDIEVYTELLYNKRKTHTDGFQQGSVFQFTGSSILPNFFCDPSSDFNCNPGDAGDPLNTAFSGNYLLRPLFLVESDSGTNIDYYRGVVGFRGDFGGALTGWNWDIYGHYSRSDGEYNQDVILDDAIFTQDFRTRSCVGLNTPVTNTPCIDINFLDPRVLRGDFTPQERAFLFSNETGNTRYEQTSGEAIVSGNLFDLPAGGVGVALGTQIRRDEIRDVPGEVTLAGNANRRTSSGITAGRTVSKEVFGEIEVPLIYNTPLIQQLTLSGAARYTSVDATRRDGVKDSFSDFTWKAGVNWEVTDWLRLRGSWGTSFRAPALFELFLENQTGFQGQQDIDICTNLQTKLDNGTTNQRIVDNCAADGIGLNFAGATGSATITSGGGIGTLAPETSTAKTASVVFTPDVSGFLWDGLSFSLAVDYFDISIDDEITTLGAGNIIIGCYNSEFFPNEPLCDQITRSPAGATDEFNITAVSDTFVNINSQDNRGIDVTARIVQDLGNLGTLSLLGQMTWQIEDKIELFDGTPIDDNGENGEPIWVGDFNITWNKGAVSAFWGIDVIGGTSDEEDLLDTQGSLCRTSIFRPGPEFCPDTRLSPTFYHSASLSLRVQDSFTITAGMSNLFNTRPPRASTVFAGVRSIGQAPVFASQYDYVGRRAFVSVNAAF
ncbi:TonB-dependent receptor [Sphingorhabdus sp. Alg239-R122]|uniref:TonB-dependent receptor domain-containing protein n=1 Tax=Sphingorhabdus sp. Alg239-R122 TaxID=2305989 RepID=UPI0013D8E884|nr:TonB-dependent receptor [Sphingorhabdus sp. Alg239-R122]